MTKPKNIIANADFALGYAQGKFECREKIIAMRELFDSKEKRYKKEIANLQSRLVDDRLLKAIERKTSQDNRF